MHRFILIILSLLPCTLHSQGFNKVIQFSDSLAHTLNAEASVSNEQYSWIACFPGSRSPQYNRTLLLYKTDQSGTPVDSLLFAITELNSLYSSHYPVFLFLSGDSLLRAILHANDSIGRAIHILGIDPDAMTLRWQRVYRSNLPRDFIGSSISSACQIHNDSLAILYSNYNTESGVVSILGDSGQLARQFVVGPSNPMVFQEISFQHGNFWFIGYRRTSDIKNHPCVMEVDHKGNELFFYQFDYSDRIGLYGSLMVRNQQHFGFLVTRLKKKVYRVTGDSFDAGQGVLVEYDGSRQRESLSVVDSLSFFFSQEHAAHGLHYDAFLAGGDKTYINTAFYTTDYGYLAKTRLGQGELWSRRFRFVREPSADTAFTQLRFKHVEPLADGGALAVGYFSLDINSQNIPVRKGQAWIVRVDSFGCVVPGCQQSITALFPENKTARLLIAPNPVSDVAHIHWQSREPGEARFQLRDAQGRIVRKWQNHGMEATFILSLKDLPSGLYFLDGWQSGKQLERKKLVKK